MLLVNQRNDSQRALENDQHGRPQRVAEWPRSSWQHNERSLQNTNDASNASVSVNEWNRREPMQTYEWNYCSESVQRPPHRSPPHQPVYQTPQPSFLTMDILTMWVATETKRITEKLPAAISNIRTKIGDKKCSACSTQIHIRYCVTGGEQSDEGTWVMTCAKMIALVVWNMGRDINFVWCYR